MDKQFTAGFPREKTPHDYEHIEALCGPDAYSTGHMDGWNDCRRAMLEAQEKAVPVASISIHGTPDGHTIPNVSMNQRLPVGYYEVFLCSGPADVERLAEALRKIVDIDYVKRCCNNGIEVHYPDAPPEMECCDDPDVDFGPFAQIAMDALAAHSAQAQPPAARVPDIDTMVNRFLSWRLPQDFAPDAGISFKPMPDEYMPHCWPTGTNLFHAGQVKEMILHMLAAQENPNG